MIWGGGGSDSSLCSFLLFVVLTNELCNGVDKNRTNGGKEVVVVVFCTVMVYSLYVLQRCLRMWRQASKQAIVVEKDLSDSDNFKEDGNQRCWDDGWNEHVLQFFHSIVVSVFVLFFVCDTTRCEMNGKRQRNKRIRDGKRTEQRNGRWPPHPHQPSLLPYVHQN